MLLPCVSTHRHGDHSGFPREWRPHFCRENSGRCRSSLLLRTKIPLPIPRPPTQLNLAPKLQMESCFFGPLDYSLFLRYAPGCVMCRNGKQRLICFQPNFGVGVCSLAEIEIPGDHRGYPLRSPGICRGYRRGHARDVVAKSFASGDSLKTYPRTKNVVR